ncbi:hypothetical protein BDZ94DRAFT_1238617 [Collybia nuda]|uniref:Uncharacterized protein n=1 Tax=Collybia nuda TaxID=64659 RepID=A0A9P5Y2W2_9AGAR|nr:hypothetical protein BDZ94DRAFT_1238617 [Collybia nuda]
MAPFSVNPWRKCSSEISPASANFSKIGAAITPAIPPFVTESNKQPHIGLGSGSASASSSSGMPTTLVTATTTVTYTTMYTTTTTPPTPATAGPMSVAAKVNTKAIVPGIISAAIAILALSFLARCIIRRRRQHRQKENSQITNAYPFSDPDVPPTRAFSIPPRKPKNVGRHNEPLMPAALSAYSEDPPPQYS